MLHIALVANLTSAIGAAPTLGRPNFPQRSGYFPSGLQLDLLPFGDQALGHFLFLERPEGMDRPDAADFVPTAAPATPSTSTRPCPGARSSRPSVISIAASPMGCGRSRPGWVSERCSSAHLGPRPLSSCSAGRR